MNELKSKSYWIHSFATPFSSFHVAFDPETAAVKASGFASTPDCLTDLLPHESETQKRPTAAIHAIDGVSRFLDSYLACAPDHREVKLFINPAATTFQIKVWGALSSISFGNTLSYREVATNAGSPAAHRAAGSACGANKLALFIPCHRAVSSTNGAGGFRWGTVLKTDLLNHESNARCS